MRLLVSACVLIALIFTAAPASSQTAQDGGNRISRGMSIDPSKRDRYLLQGTTPTIVQGTSSTAVRPVNPDTVDSCPQSTCSCKGGGCDSGCCGAAR
jgi:hypothetical protein